MPASAMTLSGRSGGLLTHSSYTTPRDTTLSGGARCICIGYAARGVAGLHGGCMALPAGEPPMSIEIIPTGAALGAEIRGVDLARPIDDETFAAIERAYNDHAVIFFRD